MTEHAEIIDHPHQTRTAIKNFIPTPLKIIGAIPIVLNALILAFMSLWFLGSAFGIHVALGFVVLLTPLGWILAFPTILGFSTLGWFDLSQNLSKFEFWTKVILLFLGAIILPWLLYWGITFFEGFILAFLYSFFD